MSDDVKSPFLIGITGHMNLRPDEDGRLRKQVKLLFRFLKYGPHGEKGNEYRKYLDPLLDELPEPKAGSRNPYDMLEHWPGLPKTPIVVLSSLAPGADTLVAQVACEMGFSVRAPLPFPHDKYREASTFVRAGAAADSNSKRQSDYDKILDGIGKCNTFPVVLEDDRGRDWESLQTRFDIDRDSEVCRRKRYKAAGEYIAAFSHLLIAIWDGKDDPKSDCGTDAIVKARRRGLTPDVLLMTQNLTLADIGLVVHLASHEPETPQEGPADQKRTVRFLHPVDSAPDSDDSPQKPQVSDDDPGWQEDGLALFCRIGQNLDAFNKLPAPDHSSIDQEMKKRVVCPGDNGEPKRQAPALPSLTEDTREGLRRIGSLRLRASQASGRLDGRGKKAVKWLFLFTAIAAILLHFFAHWHVKSGHGHGDETASASAPPSSNAGSPVPGVPGSESKVGLDDHAASPSADKHKHGTGEAPPADAGTAIPSHGADQISSKLKNAEGTSDHQPHTTCRLVWGALSLLLGFGAIVIFWWHESKGTNERAHDYRALAEALRVQFYWNLAGIGYAVTPHYLQRQRSELDWIRSAVRAALFPFERWKWWFEKQTRPEQIAALRCVLEGWLCGQRKYFRDAFHKRHNSQHRWHKLGRVLALAGIVTVLILWIAAVNGSEMDWAKRYYWLLFLAALGSAAVGYVWGRVGPPPAHDRPNSEPDHRDVVTKRVDALIPSTGTWDRRQAICGPRCARMLSNIFQHDHTSKTVWFRRGRMLINFFKHIPAAIAVSLTLLALCGSITNLPRLSACLPGPFDLAIIAGGACLLVGALAVAWAEKRLYSEFAYQFSAMHQLFKAAERKMEQQLDKLDSQLSEPDKFHHTLRKTQKLLVELGREALAENAEWLILHRARPLEPVMAG